MNIDGKYPSYSYVFDEFDIDESYLFDSEFNDFVDGHEHGFKKFYSNSLKRGGHYIPIFKSMLLEEDLSDLFVYLSMIESGFQTDAVSPKAATGMWQFMEATAKQYNLSVYRDFDERLDPILSTNAAIAYIHKLYKDFGKWYLVMMAYNCGEGRLKKAIEQAGTDEISILMEYIPKETHDYIHKILLVAMIGENIALGFSNDIDAVGELYGLGATQVEVDAGESLEYVAKLIDMKPKILLQYNHHFKNGAVPIKLPSYMMNIPNDKIIDFYTKYQLKKELENEPKTHFLSHDVKPKETLTVISQRYKTSIKELILTNSLTGKPIKPQQTLIIPVTGDVFAKYSQ